ncbi:MAG TPA: metallophosphoesterase, partial [Anaeromyxobacteraceae bacterium]
ARAAACLAAALSACCPGEGAPRSRQAPLPASAPAAAPGAPALRVLLVGDLGDDTCQRDAVSQGMARATRGAAFDLALALGDNVYDCGPDPALPGAEACSFGPDGATAAPGYRPPEDPAYRRAHDDAVAALLDRAGDALPVWMVLGNHDVASAGGCAVPRLSAEETGRRRACLEASRRAPGWRMGGRHYALDAGPARFVVLDSNLLVGDYGGFSAGDEAAFARAALAGCEARPCFVALHHPPASAGSHGVSHAPDRRAALEAEVSGLAAAFLAGHDHDLQHLRTEAGTDVFVSGNGSRGRGRERFHRVEPPGASLLFASTAWGFATLEVWGSGAWALRFENARGRALHCCRSGSAAGPCVPAPCEPAPP